MIEQASEISPKQKEPETNTVYNKPCCQPKTIFLVVLGLLVVAGAVYAGIQIGKKNQSKVWVEPPLTVITSQPTKIPTSDETANWKTLFDKNSLFTIMYPSEFHEQTYIGCADEIPDCKVGGGITTNESDSINENDINFRFLLGTKLTNETLIEYLNRTLLRGQTGPLGNKPLHYEPKNLEELLIDNKNALFYTGCNEAVECIEVHIPVNNTKVISVFIHEGTAGKTERNMSVYKDNVRRIKQILSTFRFTDSNSTAQLIEPDGRQIGFIKKVYYQSDQQYIDIDYVEWLADTAGEKACIEDKQCSADCVQVHCLSNGYYIRNNNQKIRTLVLDKNFTIEILDRDGNQNSKSVDFEVFQKHVLENITKNGAESNLFWITISNGRVTNITEQYRP